MTRVCIHQPDFLPWLGFFDRLVDTDVYVMLDDVQFLRRGFHHRDRIKTAQGTPWLTVPVVRGPRRQRIDEVEIAPGAAMGKLVATLRHAYRRAPFFRTIFPPLADVLTAEHRRLVDLNRALIDHVLGVLDISVAMVSAATFATSLRGTERLTFLTEAVGGTHYVTGTGSLDYLDRHAFAAAGIELEIRRYPDAPYRQLHGPFVPRLSVVDALFNLGPEQTRARLGRPGAHPTSPETPRSSAAETVMIAP
ncbi:MAG: WbqC family protein [Myxococcota bacterium]